MSLRRRIENKIASSTTAAEVHVIRISLCCGIIQRYHQHLRPLCWGTQQQRDVL